MSSRAESQQISPLQVVATSISAPRPSSYLFAFISLSTFMCCTLPSAKCHHVCLFACLPCLLFLLCASMWLITRCQLKRNSHHSYSVTDTMTSQAATRMAAIGRAAVVASSRRGLSSTSASPLLKSSSSLRAAAAATDGGTINGGGLRCFATSGSGSDGPSDNSTKDTKRNERQQKQQQNTGSTGRNTNSHGRINPKLAHRKGKSHAVHDAYPGREADELVKDSVEASNGRPAYRRFGGAGRGGGGAGGRGDGRAGRGGGGGGGRYGGGHRGRGQNNQSQGRTRTKLSDIIKSTASADADTSKSAPASASALESKGGLTGLFAGFVEQGMDVPKPKAPKRPAAAPYEQQQQGGRGGRGGRGGCIG